MFDPVPFEGTTLWDAAEKMTSGSQGKSIKRKDASGSFTITVRGDISRVGRRGPEIVTKRPDISILVPLFVRTLLLECVCGVWVKKSPKSKCPTDINCE